MVDLVNCAKSVYSSLDRAGGYPTLTPFGDVARYSFPYQRHAIPTLTTTSDSQRESLAGALILAGRSLAATRSRVRPTFRLAPTLSERP
jgi:hypothetical protein